jgi:phosphoribosylformylglycinamidine cyclo-ligase
MPASTSTLARRWSSGSSRWRAGHAAEVLADVGGFAGLCGLPAGYRDPILVSGTDGVGTKLKSPSPPASRHGRHRSGRHERQRRAVTGAEPLFFLDYFATGKLEVGVAEQVIKGIAARLPRRRLRPPRRRDRRAPGMYARGEYDLAGFAVGVVERDQVRDGRALAAGDRIIGLASSGLHSNGHSLARKLLLEVRGHGWDDRPEALGGASIADELLRPTRIYVKALRELSRAGVLWRGAAHITGGGLVDNPPRFVPDGRELALRFTRELGGPADFGYLASSGAGVATRRCAAPSTWGWAWWSPSRRGRRRRARDAEPPPASTPASSAR